MTAKKATVAKTVAKPPRPTIKYRYGGMLATSIDARYWGHTKKTVPTKRLKELKIKALKSRKVSDLQAQLEAFANENGVPVDSITLSGRYSYSTVVQMECIVDESDEQFAKRVAAVQRHNKHISDYWADKKAQKAWDKKYYVPPAPKVSPTRSYPQDIQILLQTVLNDSEIEAIIRRKYR